MGGKAKSVGYCTYICNYDSFSLLPTASFDFVVIVSRAFNVSPKTIATGDRIPYGPFSETRFSSGQYLTLAGRRPVSAVFFKWFRVTKLPPLTNRRRKRTTALVMFTM